MVQIVVILAVLGLCVGSFINALVWRLHEQGKNQKSKTKNQKLSILSGRSMCPHCRHELAWHDLIPVFSWLALRGRCRYCKKPVSVQYPLVETLSGLVFVLSYLFWPADLGDKGQIILFITWLVSSVGLLALAVYDLRWMVLPTKVVYPIFIAAVAGRIAYLAVQHSRLWHALLFWALSVLISSGLFFGLFTISKGKWIGFGDVRLGLVTGTLLADPQKSLAMLFLASLMGTVVSLPALLKGDKNMASKLPYGPFLITATAIMVLFGDSLIGWYKTLFGL